MAACRSESGSGIVQLALAKLSPTAGGDNDWTIIGPGGGKLGTPVAVSFSGSFYFSLPCLCAF